MRIAHPSLPLHHSGTATRDFQSSISIEALFHRCHLDVQGLLHQQLLSSSPVPAPQRTLLESGLRSLDVDSSSLRSWHWRRRRPDPGCGRGMLITPSASSGRAQPRNSFTISTRSGRPSSSRWSRKKMGNSLSLTCYSGEEEMAAWMSLSTGSPHIQTGISTSSPIIRPT